MLASDDLTPQQKAWLGEAQVSFRFFCASLQIRIKDERDGSETDGQLGPFIWRPAQRVVWAWMCLQMAKGMPIDLVILKARQFGISTFFCAWLFWWMWRKSGIRCMAAVQAKGLTMNVLSETMDRFYQSLPEGFRPQLRSKGAERLSKEEVYFDDRKSGCNFVAADLKNSGRSDALDHAFWTEVGACRRADEFAKEFQPAMANRRGTTLVLESTAAPGYYRDKYQSAKRRNSAIFLPWSSAPEMYSRKLIVDHQGRRKVFRDAFSEEIVKFTAADRKEMEFLSRQHEQINEACGQNLLPPVSEEQMHWWHWYCDTKYDGDDDYMRQEFPRDDISAFEYGSTSAFKVCLPYARATKADEAYDQCPDFMYATLESPSDLTDNDANIDIYAVENEKPNQFWQEREPGIEIYHPPVPGYLYTIGVDVADDIETAQDEEDANFSVISVYCCNTREQAAEWRGSMDPHDLGDEVAKVGYYYNTALVCVEYNNMGITTIDRLTRYLAYPNQFKWPIMDEVGKLHKHKQHWVTDPKSKQQMIGAFRSAVRHGYYIVRSPGLYEEMMGYQNVNGEYKAGPDTFADRIIAAGLAWMGVATQDDPEMMALVFGSRMTAAGIDAIERAPGQAHRHLVRADRDAFERPPRRLPAEFEDEKGPTQRVEDNWVFELAEGFINA